MVHGKRDYRHYSQETQQGKNYNLFPGLLRHQERAFELRVISSTRDGIEGIQSERNIKSQKWERNQRCNSGNRKESNVDERKL